MKVVIVEDEIRIREGILHLLEKHYPHITQIAQAKSGMEGLQMIRELKSNLVITDIRMEPMDGLEMLSILNEENYTFKTVILSAYSEFAYAKKALELRAMEYLVKPIDLEEFHAMMQRVQGELQKERHQHDNLTQFSGLDTIFSGHMNGRLVADSEMQRYMERNFQLDSTSRFYLLGAHLGPNLWKQSHHVMDALQNLVARDDLPPCELISVAPMHMLVAVFYSGETAMENLERFLQVSLRHLYMQSTNIPVLFASIHCSRMEFLQDAFVQLEELFSWGIVLGSGQLLTKNQVDTVQPRALVYPIQLEKDSVVALCRADYLQLNELSIEFLNQCVALPCKPEALKKAVMRYLNALLHVVKGLDYGVYETVNELQIMEDINVSVSQDGLSMLLQKTIESLEPTGQVEGGPLVAKAQRIVEEYYHQGITLEEVATTLGFTPDYISMQFTRELGANFSTYIRNYRMQKAKELLIATELKMYEIAAKVGYSDPKYFSRVFRESEGMVPADYRKRHRTG